MKLAKNEPAIIIGLLITILTGLAQLASSGNLTWAAAVPVIAAALIRQFVTPAP
jgi:hypothetical protein